MKTKILSTFIILFLCTKILNAQHIWDVSSEVKGDKILIHYTLLGGKFYEQFNISVYVSRDSGKTFTGPLKEVKGDVGSNIKRGDRTIVWDVLREMPMSDELLVFDVRADVITEHVKTSFFAAYVGNPQTYLGLRFGTLGKVGIYGEVRGNTNAFQNANYTYKDGSLMNYDKPGYYQFTGTNGYAAFSVIAGINFQPARNLFLYGGVGYGKENYLVQIEDYGYQGSTEIGKSYAKYDGYSFSGVEVDAGLMYRIKWFLISIGGTTINFKSANWTAGLGVCF
jgi:hypothetical protein